MSSSSVSFSSLSNLRIGLIVVFVLTLLAIFIQLCYVLWRRRLLRRHHFSGTESDITTGTHDLYTITSPSKELLYFLCWKNQARIEPTFRSSTTEPHGTAPVEPVDDDDDDFKLQEAILYGPSRLLFTIKEEKEEFEYSDRQMKTPKTDDDDQMSTKENDKERVSLEEGLERTGEVDEHDQGSSMVKIMINDVHNDEDDQGSSMVMIPINDDEDYDDDERESGQFSTPCGSPPYYTPTPSPPREDDDGNLTQIDGVFVFDEDHLEAEYKLVNNKEYCVNLDV